MNRGFTLIEILVVVSIISLLSSIFTTSASAAREKARDAKRVQELRQIDNAVNLYISDNGHAPYLQGLCPATSVDIDPSMVDNCIANSGGTGASLDAWNRLRSDLSKYITLPADPCGSYSSCVNKGLGYKYVSPAALKYGCAKGSVTCSVSGVTAFNSSYQLSAKSEYGGNRTGINNFADSFFNPDPYVNPGGGYGGGS
jgi:prepilin-type N-terminal cleavage/methylation domain-containing protein